MYCLETWLIVLQEVLVLSVEMAVGASSARESYTLVGVNGENRNDFYTGYNILNM